MPRVGFDRFRFPVREAIIIVASIAVGAAHAAASGDTTASAAPTIATDSASPTSSGSAVGVDARPVTAPAAAATPDLTVQPSTPAAPAAASPAPAAGPDESTNEDVAPSAPAQPAATRVDADAPIAQELRQLASGKYDNVIGGKQDRILIDAFYSGRDYAPLWIADGKPNARANAAIAYLGHVDADGLDPADYPVPNFADLTDPAALADAEIRMTASVITYAHHAEIGRAHWSRVSGDILYD